MRIDARFDAFVRASMSLALGREYARGRARYTGMTNDHGGRSSIGMPCTCGGHINESCPRGRILREYETLMDRCVFADGNEWSMAACRFIPDERFCHSGRAPKLPCKTIRTEVGGKHFHSFLSFPL